ncbi:hypothetical protein GCM10027286_03200 [Virgibacillus ainsalahensis]
MTFQFANKIIKGSLIITNGKAIFLLEREEKGIVINEDVARVLQDALIEKKTYYLYR